MSEENVASVLLDVRGGEENAEKSSNEENEEEEAKKSHHHENCTGYHIILLRLG